LRGAGAGAVAAEGRYLASSDATSEARSVLGATWGLRADDDGAAKGDVIIIDDATETGAGNLYTDTLIVRGRQ
jgi:hypothetical protein